VRLALLAVGGRIVTGCSARPAVAWKDLAPCGKTVFFDAARGAAGGAAAARPAGGAPPPRVVRGVGRVAVRQGECEER